MDCTTIIRNLNILREKGLITEVPGAGSRSTLIQLTDVGEAIIAEGLILRKQAQSQIKATIGVDSIEDLLRILTNIEMPN